MPVEDIEKSHRHLPQASSLKPRAARRGLVSRILALLGQKGIDGKWEAKSPKAVNWQSERGSFDPELPYAPGKPQKKGKSVTNTPAAREAGEIAPLLNEALKHEFPEAEGLAGFQHAAWKIPANKIPAVINWFKSVSIGESSDNSACKTFSLPLHVNAIDRMSDDKIEVIYALRRADGSEQVNIHTELERSAPVIPSAAEIFPAFNWHEREIAELFGVTFTDHPDPRKLLLDSTYTGFPLRKDYEDAEHEFIKKPD
ncbi:MAG: NADH-quinone oxidoreductase subunit C [bacterium]|nr:NADH-quinone oxidoreductase subunit C [bacterium]